MVTKVLLVSDTRASGTVERRSSRARLKDRTDPECSLIRIGRELKRRGASDIKECSLRDRIAVLDPVRGGELD